MIHILCKLNDPVGQNFAHKNLDYKIIPHYFGQNAANFRFLLFFNDNYHRVDRVLSFFSCRPNWDSSPAHPQRRRVCPPLLCFRRVTHSLGGEGGGGVPIPTRRQTLWYSWYIQSADDKLGQTLWKHSNH